MLLQRELYAVPSAAFCLGEEQIGAQQFNNSCTFCYFRPLHTNLDRRSTEPTEITPFLGNFPDSTLSSPSRTANALILGLDSRTRARDGVDSGRETRRLAYALGRLTPPRRAGTSPV